MSDSYDKFIHLWGWRLVFTLIPVFLATAFLYSYANAIKKRLGQVKDKSRMMSRDKNQQGSLEFCLLELNSDFLKAHEDKWQLQSMGSYLSSIRPTFLPDDAGASSFIKNELEAFLSNILLDKLGSLVGSAILPVLGFSSIESTIIRVTGKISAWLTSHFIAHRAQKDDDEKMDSGATPFSLYDLSALANLTQGLPINDMKISPLAALKHGNVDPSPSFGSDISLPNPFIVEEHWDQAIEDMENQYRIALKGAFSERQSIKSVTLENEQNLQGNNLYDPDDRSLPEPTPINQRLFPDLYFGWGSAECTHTNREIIRNRLMATILNRLAHNYCIIESTETEISHKDHEQNVFAVKMKSTDEHTITSAKNFVKVLIKAGHKIEVCPRSTITTFGLAACIKEEDGSWTNVPLALVFKTGYEDKNKRAVHVAAPHGGLDLDISGPLVGDHNRCNIQFYIAIEGLCGWHSNHNSNVPWIKPVSSTEPYSVEMALDAVHMASLLSYTFNAIGTDQNLPFGGYGVLGLCNDTAALLDQALRGTTGMYPLFSTGRFLIHISNRLMVLRKNFMSAKNPKLLEAEIDALQRLLTASITIGSDLHAGPANIIDGAKRYLCRLSEVCTFQLQKESKDIILAMLEDYEAYIKIKEK
mmetsp:Transcript_19329/g.28604  ORF Transcript_19329/g.28604 Transcript_19329/m.28604 type:complete len:643 (-) Transcript_19329:116-2044(-)|eukprot:CAMPEP_0194258770 /NCGR_PEP_ID=MMETSP0158-20130606/42024_1 /TAXON_ID=33649 /ORGANISM="Thalassionema nitzschioides, Strain L26-B" /LENGTH=642 /DNA_ID=CAMNT_0038998299 /DNA_START=38 /DNA_END=1966 /DNA_ORIENTATION=-